MAKFYNSLQRNASYLIHRNPYPMKEIKYSAVLILCVSLMWSCSLHSTTYIKSKERFLLGDNTHGTFRVKLKNISENEIEIHRAPIGGGRHSGISVAPGQTVRVRVESNTSLVIMNNSEAEASVQLKVVGDTGLSMNYKSN